MKAFPNDDPRSFSQQAYVHCAYCNGAYDQVGFPNLELQNLSQTHRRPDVRVAVLEPGRASWHATPCLVRQPRLSAIRRAPRFETSAVDSHRSLDFNGTDETMSNDVQIDANLKIMYRQMVSNSKKPLLFFGSPLRAGTEPDPGSGSIEGNKNKDINDKDWLDTGFLFYDENAELVRVTVRDCLDNKRLGEGGGGKDFPIDLENKISTVVPRPKRKKRRKKEKEDEEEILVIEGIEFEKDVAVKFDVGPDKSEFAGSFVNVPHKQKERKKSKSCLRLGLMDLLEDLGAEDDESVVVTLVPRYGAQAVKIGSIKIEFLA
ncbi:hypothetical protein TB2_036271 [Malus domestica]